MNPDKIVKPQQLKVVEHNDIYCGYDENLINDFSADMLDSHYWQNQDAIIGSAKGRGTTYFVSYLQQHWVLRHYYRGGMIGKVNKDKYLFHTLATTRAVKEFTLLTQLNQLQLPAPKPVAYRVVKQGHFYQADLLTEKIANANDLVATLAKNPIEQSLWRAIGATIQRFHQQGIYHHDLNAHNILIDDNQQVWVIDFDRGEQRTPKSSWQQSNLARLLRSFNKEKRKLASFHWQSQHWQWLLQGYDGKNE